MTDTQIIELYWSRDESAISCTAQKYGGYCKSIARNILRSEEDAEECVNDTYWGAWRAIPPQRPARFPAFLGRIARNLALNRFRQYGAEKRGAGQTALALAELEECLPSQDDTAVAAEDRRIIEALNSFLYAQPAQKRAVFIRRYWYLEPIRQIAAACGMSESKAASLLFRMRKELKSHLEKEDIAI